MRPGAPGPAPTNVTPAGELRPGAAGAPAPVDSSGMVTVLSDLDGQRALPDRRQHLVGIQDDGVAGPQAQSPEPGGGQDDRVVGALLEPAEPRVHVPPYRLGDEIRAPGQELDAPPRAR